MDGIFTDKEVLADGLAAAKASTNLYNNFSNECSHERVRNVMLDILADEHDIQDDVFHMMSSKGYYPTPAAEEKKIEEARTKYRQL
ncbi:MAG: spore coat protein [Butyrivibrio sp.]